MHQVEAVAGLAYKDEDAEAEELGERIDTREAENQAAEERHEYAVVDEGIRHASVNEDAIDGGKPEEADYRPQPARSRQRLIQAGQQHAKDEAGQVRQW